MSSYFQEQARLTVLKGIIRVVRVTFVAAGISNSERYSYIRAMSSIYDDLEALWKNDGTLSRVPVTAPRDMPEIIQLFSLFEKEASDGVSTTRDEA